MIIGVPKEIKNHEYRVGLTPGSVRELIEHGHSVLVETGAAVGIGMMDADYTRVGATISPTAQEVFANSELIVKVKEPQPAECRMLGAGQVLFTYLHLAPDPNQAQLLLESGVTAIAYETVTGPGNTLPLLAPMSEVAGRLSIQAGAHCLERAQGGQGVLLSGVPGVAPARLLVIGGGTVGDNAAHMARGMGADVTILDRSIPRLRQLDQHYEGSIKCVHSTSEAVEHYALQADLVIGAVLVPGATTPKVLTADVVRRMKTGSVVVDVSIDQGGCFETARPTTHEAPTYVVDGVVHYCVANMPSVVPRTSTLALNNATLPFVLTLADRGFPDALRFDPDLAQGLNIHEGKVTHEAVARDLGYEHHSVDSVLGLTRGFSATA
jgi:alanine dehydrogenase